MGMPVNMTTGVQSPSAETAEGLAIHPGHPQVENDEVARRHAKVSPTPRSIRGFAHLVTGGFQRGPQHEPHVRLVVNDQDAFRWEHVTVFPESAESCASRQAGRVNVNAVPLPGLLLTSI